MIFLNFVLNLFIVFFSEIIPVTDINELIKVTIKYNIGCAQNGVHELLWIMMVIMPYVKKLAQNWLVSFCLFHCFMFRESFGVKTRSYLLLCT